MKTLYCLGLTAVLPALLLAQPVKPGTTVCDFTLAGANPVTFSAVKGSINVVTFISVQCPVSNAYNDRMKALCAARRLVCSSTPRWDVMSCSRC